jgi:hypothetical protein
MLDILYSKFWAATIRQLGLKAWIGSASKRIQQLLSLVDHSVNLSTSSTKVWVVLHFSFPILGSVSYSRRKPPILLIS